MHEWAPSAPARRRSSGNEHAPLSASQRQGENDLDLTKAIETFNQSSQPQIERGTTRDGRVVATLPRLGREIVVGDSTVGNGAQVTPADVALLCEEARRAAAPGLELLQAALGNLPTTLPANR